MARVLSLLAAAVLGCGSPDAAEPDPPLACDGTLAAAGALVALASIPEDECSGWGDYADLEQTPLGWTRSLADFLDAFAGTRSGEYTTPGGDVGPLEVTSAPTERASWRRLDATDADGCYLGCYDLVMVDLILAFDADAHVSFVVEDESKFNACHDVAGFRGEVDATEVVGGDPPVFEPEDVLVVAYTASGLSADDWEGTARWKREDSYDDYSDTTTEDLVSFSLD